MKLPKNTGTALKTAVAQYLELRGYDVLKFNSGGAVVPGKRGGRDRWVRFGPTGMPDLIALGDDAVTLWVEVKTPGQPLRDTQRAFASRLEARGHLYLVVRSINDVKDALDSLES